MTGSNCRPSPCKGDALPTELITHLKNIYDFYRENFVFKTPYLYSKIKGRDF